MKRVLLIVLILVGCVQDFSVDISNTKILWQGYVNEDPTYLQKFNETSACVSEVEYHRSGYPYLIIVDDFFMCNGVFSPGCVKFSNNTIYLTQTGEISEDPNTVKILAHDTFKHEVVHWITLKTDVYHDELYFQDCQMSIKNFGIPYS